jgi:hypothetical protein
MIPATRKPPAYKHFQQSYASRKQECPHWQKTTKNSRNWGMRDILFLVACFMCKPRKRKNLFLLLYPSNLFNMSPSMHLLQLCMVLKWLWWRLLAASTNSQVNLRIALPTSSNTTVHPKFSIYVK